MLQRRERSKSARSRLCAAQFETRWCTQRFGPNWPAIDLSAVRGPGV